MDNITEDLIVYTALRDEIIRIEESQTTYMLNMYVVFIATFAFGIQNRYLFFVAYIALIAFQSTINVQVWQMTKVSLYIKVFFEERHQGIHWESLNGYSGYEDTHSKISKTISGRFRANGAFILATITTISFAVSTLNAYIQKPFPSPQIYLEVFLFLLSIVLCILTYTANRGYRANNYHSELETIIRNYCESLSHSIT